MTALLKKLWNDEDGALVATEYLMLGSVVTIGSVTGLASVRDSMNQEYQDYGAQIREVRQAYTLPTKKTGSATTGGTAAANPYMAQPADQGYQQVPPTLNGQHVQFSAPAP